MGRPFAFMLTGGHAADSQVAPQLLAGLKGARYLLADKGYDANSLRKHQRERAIVPVIPGRSNRKRPIRYDTMRYKSRHLIENAFCRLKDFRAVATRYDKLARNFLSAVVLAIPAMNNSLGQKEFLVSCPNVESSRTVGTNRQERHSLPLFCRARSANTMVC